MLLVENKVSSYCLPEYIQVAIFNYWIEPSDYPNPKLFPLGSLNPVQHQNFTLNFSNFLFLYPTFISGEGLRK